MLSLATGHDVGYLTGPVAGGRESYYTGAVAAGEPAGLWYGAGAEVLGLRGEVDAELMEAVYSHLRDPRDPATHNRATWGVAEPLAAAHRAYRSADDVYAGLLEKNPDAGPEQRAQLRAQAERSARQAVSFIDATFSAPKSVTVMGVAFERAANDARAAGDERAAEAWSAHQRAVEDAVLAGARAALDYLQDVAGYSRVGHHGGGAGRWIDAHGWVVAQFLQHDSRDRDPQLHVHQAILNRVLGADGVWRTLDSRAIHAHRGAAGAIAERVMEAHLARSLGVRFETRPDGKAREVLGISQDVIDLFSSRRHAITARTAELVSAFRDRFGREPSAPERTRLSQQATLATRAAKAHDGETLTERLDRWEAETRERVVGGLGAVAQAVLDRAQQSDPPATWSPQDVTERALAALGGKRQSWTESDLTRAISDALPGNLRVQPEDVRALLAGLVDVAIDEAVPLAEQEETADLPPELLRADGRSVYSQPAGTRYATRGQVAAEHVLRAAAITRGAAACTADEAARVVDRFAENGRQLGADQAAAVIGVLTSGATVEVLSAAAGTGKSFVVGALAEAWADAGHQVFGLAPSQVAAQVLAEDGVTSANIARWLATQRRLDSAKPGGPVLAADEGWRLRRDDLVVVDEAGMTSTADLIEVQRRCEAAGAKLLLVGDPRQLAAVGPGGALADIGEHGTRYELVEVRRFTAEWERTASLRLRDGDEAAIEEYARHGRLVDGGTAEQAEAAAGRAWLGDVLAGRDSVLLVGSNEAAARVSAALRAELVALGRVDERGVELTAQGTVAGIGDVVQARHNGWDLIGYDGNTRAPINRETYTVTRLTADGGVVVVDAAGIETTLPGSYVTEHLALGYASTVHAAQGRTVDTAHAVIGAGTDAAGAYVALTRGRDHNTAWTITRPTPSDADTGQTLDVEPRTAQAVLADVLAQDDGSIDLGQSALDQAEQEFENARSVQRHLDRLSAEIADATAGRVGSHLDSLTATGFLRPEDRTALAADAAYGGLERLLRTAELAGHDPATVLQNALGDRPLDGARSPAQVLHARITKTLDGQLTPQITSYGDLIPDAVPDSRRARLEALAEAADDRRRELGERTANEAPQWAVEALGAVPDDAIARVDWEHRAGWAAAYRELSGHADDLDPLGAAPPAGLAETHVAWRAGHDALDLPDGGADEQQMADGQLRARVRAYERELAWAPRWVGDELPAAHQAAEKARTDAEVWQARADATQNLAEARKLREDAAAAAATAEGLAQRAAELEIADHARAVWYVHTAVSRDKAERSRSMLGTRGVDLDDPAEQTTAAEWLEAHYANEVEDERHREITEADIADDVTEHQTAEQDGRAQVETNIDDVRDVTAVHPTERDDTAATGRIPSADERATYIARAQAALAEIAARQQADAVRAAEETAEAARREELARWAEDDRIQELASMGTDDEMVRD